MLILLLVAAYILTACLEYGLWLFVSQIVRRSFDYIGLVHQLTSFPFYMICIVWLAARNGRTFLATWIVPTVILLVPLTVPVVGWMLTQDNSGIGRTLMYVQWSHWSRIYMIDYVCLAFAFRASTLHLRPVATVASPNRLTVLSILGLTTVVAFCFIVDGLINLLFSELTITRSGQGLAKLQYTTILHNAIYSAVTSLVWFSAAWLFVAANPKRWIGGLGLLVYVFAIGIIYLLIVPLLIGQQFPPGVTAPTFGFWVCSFAIQVLHIPIVFLCFGMVHLAGYRWDILRRSTSANKATEPLSDGVPPVLDEVTH